MTRTLFIDRFDRKLPRAVAYTLIAVATLALMDHYKGSLMANAQTSFSPVVAHWSTPVVDGEWLPGPRECDLQAGIATDCFFLD